MVECLHTNSSNEYRYSEVPLDSFAHHNKTHNNKIFQKLLQYRKHREESECGIEMRRKWVRYRDEKKVGVV